MASNAPPRWIKPQPTKLTDTPPDGSGRLHEIKYEGIACMPGWIAATSGCSLDRTRKYLVIAAAVASLPAEQAYLEGELCTVRSDGTTSLSAIHAASDAGNSDALVCFVFDLLHLDGEAIGSPPLIHRKARLQQLLTHAPPRCN